MKNRAKVLPPPRELCKLIPSLLFLLSVLISLVTTYYVTGHYIDSDASSELVLAKHLAETGQILSQDWIYSTELRVLNTQLVYAPLFLIFSDWHMVRFVGAIILQAIMILSYAFLIHETGLSKRVFYISAALLLLPVSVAYGRIVLYHCYYVPHISLSFVLLGLTMRFTKEIDWKKPKTWLSLFLLVLFSFIGGLGGIRQLMMTHAPMLLSIVIFCFVEDAKDASPGKAAIFSFEKLQLLTCTILAALASYIGLKINAIHLNYYFSFADQSLKYLSLIDFSKLNSIFYGFFHQFGFRDHASLISLSGILSIGGIIASIYSLIVGIGNITRHTKDNDLNKAILNSFHIYFVSIMLFVYVGTGGAHDQYHFVQYFVFCLSWVAPLLVSNLEEIPHEMHPFHVRKLFAWCMILVLLVNGLANVTFFNGHKKFDQIYEGLSFQDMSKKEGMTNLVSYLYENGYDIGYAEYWNGNILTELSDGAIRIINITFDHGAGNITYLDFLTQISLRKQVSSKPFLLLTPSSKDSFSATEEAQYCSLAYEDELYCVYDIHDIEQFKLSLS